MKKKIFFAIFAFAIVLAFSSCGTTRGMNKDVFPEFYSENPPVSILVMPPINTTTNVEAKDYFFYTLNQTLANNGYYVYPSLLAMQTLQEESAYDAELFVENDVSAFGRTFGADLVLFTTITKWEKSVVGSKVTVGIEYLLRSTKTGEKVFYRGGEFTYDADANNSGGSLLAWAVQKAVSMVAAGLTDYVAVARTCNHYALNGDIPAGKYYEEKFGKDGEEEACSEEFSYKSGDLVY